MLGKNYFESNVNNKNVDTAMVDARYPNEYKADLEKLFKSMQAIKREIPNIIHNSIYIGWLNFSLKPVLTQESIGNLFESGDFIGGGHIFPDEETILKVNGKETSVPSHKHIFLNQEKDKDIKVDYTENGFAKKIFYTEPESLQIMKLKTKNNELSASNSRLTKLLEQSQKMLSNTLHFCKDVKESVFGKIFFRKQINDLSLEELPEGIVQEDEEK